MVKRTLQSTASPNINQMTEDQAEREDEYFENWVDREADDHLGMFDDDLESWERRAGVEAEATKDSAVEATGI